MDDVKALRENQAKEAGKLFLYAGTVAGAFILFLGAVFPGLLVIALPGLAVYFAILKKVSGRRVWLDPYGAGSAASASTPGGSHSSYRTLDQVRSTCSSSR